MRKGLKVLRVKNDLTQEQMAVETCVSASTYSAVELGNLRGSEKFWNTVQERFAVADAEMWELMRNE